jgi:parallel beta-helix repeat protein
VDDSRHTEGGFNEPAYDGLTLVENNIVFDNGGRGITVFLSDHVIVRNNTCYHNLKDMNLAWRQVQGEFTAANASDVRFVNNIAVPLDKTVFGISNFQTTRVTWDFNLVDGGALPMPVESETGWGQHNIVENGGVDFVAPSVDPKTADFHLRSGSRAEGAGSIDDAPDQDFSGALRPHSGPIDLGALQASATGAAAIRN